MTNSFLTTFNESNWYNLSNINNGNTYNWPLIFEVNNKPQQNQSIFTFYSPTFSTGIQCEFTSSFPVQQQLYFMINHDFTQNQSLQIDNLVVSLLSEEEEPLYILNTEQLQWYDAENFCQFHYDSHLASIVDHSENVQALKTFGGANHWIGLINDETTEKEFEWIDGTEFDFGSTFHSVPWAPAEPSLSTSTNCVYIGYQGNKWNDDACSGQRQFLCSYPAVTEIINDDKSDYKVFGYSEGTHLGTMDILDEVRVNFDIFIHSFSINQTSTILTIGNETDFVFPLISFDSTKTNLKVIASEINGISKEYESAMNSILIDVTYNIDLYISQKEFIWYLDEILIINTTTSSHSILYGQSMILGGNQLQTETLNATINNMKISSNNMIFSDNEFNYLCDGSNRFNIISGSWVFDDDQCTVTQTDDTVQGAVTWIGDNDPESLKWTDYIVEVDITINSGYNAAILLRSQTVSATNAYTGGQQYLTALNQEVNIIAFGKIMNDGWDKFTDSSTTTLNGILYKLRVHAVGDTFTVYLDNKYQFTVTDASYSFGSIGLRTVKSNATFSSLKIMVQSYNNCLYTVWDKGECLRNPKCFYLHTKSLWEFDNGATIQNMSNTTTTINSGAPHQVTKAIFNECFWVNTSAINSIYLYYEYFYGFIQGTEDFSKFRFGLQSVSGCSNSIVLYESDELSDVPLDGKIFNDLVVKEVVIDGNIVIPDAHYVFYFEFINNNNNINLNFDSLSIHIIYKNNLGLIFNTDRVSIDEYFVNMYNITYFMASQSNRFIEETKICNGTIDCFIECNDLVLCSSAKIYLNNPSNNVVINCNASYSCFDMEIKSISNNISLTVLCNADNSCFRMQIEMDEYAQFSMLCNAENACSESFIQLNYDILIPKNKAIIECVVFSSCNGIEIITSSPKTQIILYEYSENVLLNNGVGYIQDEQNVICNNNQYIFISTPTTQQTIESIISNRYTNNLLPCNGVNIQCKQGKCSFDYSINTQIFNKLSSNTCSPVNIRDIQNIQCLGDCSSSLSPTAGPTNSPTDSPSNAPTRKPTSIQDYKYYFNINYKIGLLRQDEDIHKFITNPTEIINDITSIIEFNYIENDIVYLQYYQFWLQIKRLNDYNVEIIDKKTELSTELTLESRILTQLKNDAQNLQDVDIKNDAKFVISVTTNLRQFFNNMNLTFSVDFDSISAIKELYPIETNIDYVYYSVVGISLFIILIGVWAFGWNKGKLCGAFCGFNVVDDAKWFSVIIFAIQFYDFATDILLSLEIWNRDELWSDSVILAIAIGSTTFVIIPYLVNILIAIKLKTFAIIKKNQFATEYLDSYATIYTALVVLSAGAYPALNVVSSNVFGLKYLSSGLTPFEIEQLSKIKFIGTVIIENIPQLFIQIIYAITIDEITDALILAFIASVLSSTLSIISFCLNQSQSATKTESYYLVIGCVQRSNSVTQQNILPSADSGNNMQQTTNPIQSNSSMSMSANNGLTIEEKRLFNSNKGRTQALRNKMGQVFGINPNKLQIGTSVTTNFGIIMRFVHHIVEIELDGYKGIKEFIETLYDETKDELNNTFQEHFYIGNDFEVQLKWKITINDKTNKALSKDDQYVTNNHRMTVLNRMNSRNHSQKSQTHRTFVLELNKKLQDFSDNDNDNEYKRKLKLPQNMELELAQK